MVLQPKLTNSSAARRQLLGPFLKVLWPAPQRAQPKFWAEPMALRQVASTYYFFPQRPLLKFKFSFPRPRSRCGAYFKLPNV